MTAPLGYRPCPGDGLRACLVFIAHWRERCRFCERSVALRRAAKAAIVNGEEELGTQRCCATCQQWWPLTGEFFETRPGARWHYRSCRACRNTAAYARRFPSVAAA